MLTGSFAIACCIAVAVLGVVSAYAGFRDLHYEEKLDELGYGVEAFHQKLALVSRQSYWERVWERTAAANGLLILTLLFA